MNYLKITLLAFLLASCDKVQPDTPPLPILQEHIQFIKNDQDLLGDLELSQDKNLQGMVLKNQYQLHVYFNGKERKNYPSDLYRKTDNTAFYSLEFFTYLNWEYQWEDTGFTQNYTEYKLKCPLLFRDEQFHVIRIDFTFENREVNRTKITLDGRDGKILQQDNESSLSVITP